MNTECSALHFLLMCSLFFSFQTRGPTHAAALLLFPKANFWIVHFCHATHNDTVGWRWWTGTSKGSVHNRAGPGCSPQGRGPTTSISRCSGSWVPLTEEEPVDSHWHLPELCCCRTPITLCPHLVKEQKKKKKETSSAETSRKRCETQKG